MLHFIVEYCVECLCIGSVGLLGVLAVLFS